MPAGSVRARSTLDTSKPSLRDSTLRFGAIGMGGPVRSAARSYRMPRQRLTSARLI